MTHCSNIVHTQKYKYNYNTDPWNNLNKHHDVANSAPPTFNNNAVMPKLHKVMHMVLCMSDESPTLRFTVSIHAL